jgi:hypothetical protein
VLPPIKISFCSSSQIYLLPYRQLRWPESSSGVPQWSFPVRTVSFSKREGSKRTPSPDTSEHTSHSSTTSQASVPLESGFQQIPQLSFNTFRQQQSHMCSSPPTVYLTGPLELDEADHGTYSDTVGHGALATRYSNARRTGT